MILTNTKTDNISMDNSLNMTPRETTKMFQYTNHTFYLYMAPSVPNNALKN